ncbi:MAG: universal stress protein [Proteobacteria bacterium]|nr:universal stress protein [Pseudomonadota bacterium]
MFGKILHANDGSEGAFKALAAALNLARRYRAELHMVSVEELPWLPGTREEVVGEKALANHHFEAVAAKAAAIAKKERVKLHTHLVAGHPVSTIARLVETHRFDALVIGFMGHAALYNAIMGSTAERLVRLAPCTVIVVK